MSIDFSEFGHEDLCVLSASIRIPSYEVMTANEVLEIAALKEIVNPQSLEDPIQNMQFQVRLVGIVMRSRIGDEWSDREVGRLPVPVLRKAFEFCSTQVMGSVPTEVVPEKKKRVKGKAITEIAETAVETSEAA
jgi:hypothetical protein